MLLMAIEHERVHVETTSVLLREHSLRLLSQPALVSSRTKGDSRRHKCHASEVSEHAAGSSGIDPMCFAYYI